MEVDDGALNPISSFDFYIKNGVLHLNGKPELGVTLVNGLPYIIDTNFHGPLSEFESSKINNNITLLLLALNEITAPKANTFQVYNNKSPIIQSCSFLNTYWVYYIGGSRSTSKEALKGGKEKIIKKHEDGSDLSCTKFGDIDISCVTDNHGCIATQAYCCQ